MSDWHASLGRITLLPEPPGFSTDISAAILYRQIWGRDAEGTQNISNPLAPSMAQGRLGDLSVICSVHRSRIDLTLAPGSVDSNQPIPLTAPYIKSVSQLMDGLRSIIISVEQLPINGPVGRVALFFQFQSVQPTFEETNRTLLSSIPPSFGLNPFQGEDFIFQINTPRPSTTTTDLRLNIVSKWSADRFRLVNLLLAAPSGSMSPAMDEKDFIAADISFDINNNSVKRALTGAEQSALLREALSELINRHSQLGLDVEGLSHA